MQAAPEGASSASNPYYVPLDGLRSICVLMVMFNHLKSTFSISWLSYVHGYLGVYIFFVISGFLITTLLLREEARAGRIDISAFYWRRVFRILPVYLVVLLAYVVICQAPSQALRWTQMKAGLPYFLLFMNEYAPTPGVFTHTWSLGVEEKFYLLWPVLFFVAARTKLSRSIVLGMLFTGTAVGTMLFPDGVGPYFGLLSGCLVAYLMEAKSPLIQALKRVPSPVMMLIVFLGFWLHHENQGLRTAFCVTTGTFMAYIIVSPTWVSRLLSTKLLVWLGQRSYSMYLVHVLCMNAIEAKFHALHAYSLALVLLVSYVFAAGVAAVLFVTVEGPARRFGKRFIALRRSRSETSSATAAS